MEMSCRWFPDDSPPISVHLLAYLFDPAHPGFAAERARLRDERLERGERIVAALADDGHPVSWERIVERSDGGVVGRPHIARALVEAGVVDSVDHAFATLLHHHSPYYVAKVDTDVREGIAPGAGRRRGAGLRARTGHQARARRRRRGGRRHGRGRPDGPRGRPPRPRARRARAPARPRRRPGADRHRFQRLPRHRQDDADRGVHDRPGPVRGDPGGRDGQCALRD